MTKYFAEGVGTMFLVLLACGSAVLAGSLIGVLGIGICFGLVLFGLCYAIGGISGCHVNPAVSLAMLFSGRMKAGECAGYIVSQLIGATIGAGLLAAFVALAPDYNFGGTTPDAGASLAANVLQPGATAGMALLAEGLLSFFFIFVILCATDEKRGAGNLAGAAIGLALGLVNIVGIPVDNCSVNPARSFGPAVFGGGMPDLWIMIVGPVMGALLASVCYKAAFADKK
ncbi:MAG: aquaporin [Muribaculaceae bacterium]|nr:aquaporin [Muribaculaceae bacterium]